MLKPGSRKVGLRKGCKSWQLDFTVECKWAGAGGGGFSCIPCFLSILSISPTNEFHFHPEENIFKPPPPLQSFKAFIQMSSTSRCSMQSKSACVGFYGLDTIINIDDNILLVNFAFYQLLLRIHFHKDWPIVGGN